MTLRMNRWLPVALALFVLPALARVAAAEEAKAAQKAEQAQFLRFVDDNDGGGKLQTSIVTLQNDQGVKVHLVAAVHVGEEKYYQGLNKTFQGYDALLYEMVKPKDAPAPEPGFQSGSWVSTFQRAMKDVLELDFQLDDIDYRAKNFIHADLDAETFEKLQEERGESIWLLMLKQMMAEMDKPQAQISDVSLLELGLALASPDRARHLKLLLAKQFDDIEDKLSGLDNNTVLVTERNKAAIKALKDALADGRKNVGIFYGAAHMPDMEKRVEEMGFKKTGSEWRTAWDMTPKEGDIIIKQVKKNPAGEQEQK